jgi:hypothetical protein
MGLFVILKAPWVIVSFVKALIKQITCQFRAVHIQRFSDTSDASKSWLAYFGQTDTGIRGCLAAEYLDRAY